MVVKLNGFQANDAYGSSNGDIFEESWYNQFDALSGMEYFMLIFHSNVFFAIQEILTVKLHASSIEPMIPKSALTQSKKIISVIWLYPLKPEVKS